VHVIVIVTISDSSSVHRGRRSLQQTTATVSDVASIPTPAVDSELSPLTFQSIGVTEQNHRHAIDRDDVTSQDTHSSDKVWSLDAATHSTSTSDDHPWFRSNRDRRRRSAERLVAERTFRADDVISVSSPRTTCHRSRASSSVCSIAVMTSPEERGTFCIEFRAVSFVSVRQRTTPSTFNSPARHASMESARPSYAPANTTSPTLDACTWTHVPRRLDPAGSHRRRLTYSYRHVQPPTPNEHCHHVQPL